MSYTKANSDGSVGYGFTENRIVRIVTGAVTLTQADTGSDLVLNAAAGAAVTLPALTKGFNARIIVGAGFATTNWTVVSSTNVIQGGAVVNSTFVPAANENTISFVASAETVGDYVDITCDGTNYYVSGVAQQQVQ